MYHPQPSFFERLVSIDDRGGTGLVACIHGPVAKFDELVGEANFELLPNGNGEFSIAVARLGASPRPIRCSAECGPDRMSEVRARGSPLNALRSGPSPLSL